MKTGIYQIRNLVNGKLYIGSCASNKGFPTRWSKHRKQLERGLHHSPKLQNSWNKHGADAFVFEVLLCCDPQDCLMYEQIALDHFKPEYNICQLAGSCLGVKRSEAFKRMVSYTSSIRRHSQESKLKISKSRLGNKYALGSKRSEASLKKMRAAQSGSRNPSAKLVEKDVIQIRQLLIQGLSRQEIADKFCVSYATIGLIERRQIWRNTP